MKKALTLLLAAVLLALCCTGCGPVTAMKLIGVSSEKQIEKIVLSEGFTMLDVDMSTGAVDLNTADLTGTPEGAKYLESLFSVPAAERETFPEMIPDPTPDGSITLYFSQEDNTQPYQRVMIHIIEKKKDTVTLLVMSVRKDEDEKETNPEEKWLVLSTTDELYDEDYIRKIVAENKEN